MRAVRLIVAHDEYDSAPGLAVRGTYTNADDFMADREGGLVAHDLLEHMNGAGEIGSVWDECEALGALYYVRGQYGDLLQERPSYHPVWYNLAGDLSRMFEQWRSEGYDGPNIAALYKQRPLRDECAERDFARAIEKARADIPREDSDAFTVSQWTTEEDALRARDAIAPYCLMALQRMRLGYRKAARRYRNAWAAHNQFRAVRDACKSALREHSDYLHEGMELVLTYGNGRANVRLVEE